MSGSEILGFGWQVLAAALGAVIGCVGAYIAIRVSIATLMERTNALEIRLIERLKSAESQIERLSSRLDRIFIEGKRL